MTPKLHWTFDFYPRPPRGGRQNPAVRDFDQQTFLSTPSARRATDCCTCLQWDNIFLSTPSARRATGPIDSAKQKFNISIHALREEGDTLLLIRIALI